MTHTGDVCCCKVSTGPSKAAHSSQSKGGRGAGGGGGRGKGAKTGSKGGKGGRGGMRRAPSLIFGEEGSRRRSVNVRSVVSSGASHAPACLHPLLSGAGLHLLLSSISEG
jgi:hypothetical protein